MDDPSLGGGLRSTVDIFQAYLSSQHKNTDLLVAYAERLLEFAREFGLSANTVEKDYVLGWLLAGIFNHQDLAENWVFKGGTCLKKCFFETCRFSEDLDFTLLTAWRSPSPHRC